MHSTIKITTTMLFVYFYWPFFTQGFFPGLSPSPPHTTVSFLVIFIYYYYYCVVFFSYCFSARCYYNYFSSLPSLFPILNEIYLFIFTTAAYSGLCFTSFFMLAMASRSWCIHKSFCCEDVASHMNDFTSERNLKELSELLETCALAKSITWCTLNFFSSFRSLFYLFIFFTSNYLTTVLHNNNYYVLEK